MIWTELNWKLSTVDMWRWFWNAQTCVFWEKNNGFQHSETLMTGSNQVCYIERSYEPWILSLDDYLSAVPDDTEKRIMIWAVPGQVYLHAFVNRAA